MQHSLSILEHLKSLLRSPSGTSETEVLQLKSFIFLYKKYLGPDETYLDLISEVCEQISTLTSSLCFFLKVWLSCAWELEFWKNNGLRENLLNFCQKYLSAQETQNFQMAFLQTTKDCLASKRELKQSKIGNPEAPVIPETALPKNEILWQDNETVAHCLTHLKSTLFKSTRSRDLMLNSQDLSKHAPYFNQIIRSFNMVSGWVSSVIVSENNLVKRLFLLQYFIDLAQTLKDQLNLDTSAAVIAGLNCSSILRLKTLWKGLEQEYKKKFDDLDSLFSPQQNFSVYRTFIKTIPPEKPCIPFFAVFSKDMMSLSEISDWTPDGRVNQEKINLIAKQLESYRQFQISQKDLPTRTFPTRIKQSLENLNFLTEDQIYECSLRLHRRPVVAPILGPPALSPREATTLRVSRSLSELPTLMIALNKAKTIQSPPMSPSSHSTCPSPPICSSPPSPSSSPVSGVPRKKRSGSAIASFWRGAGKDRKQLTISQPIMPTLTHPIIITPINSDPSSKISPQKVSMEEEKKFDTNCLCPTTINVPTSPKVSKTPRSSKSKETSSRAHRSTSVNF